MQTVVVAGSPGRAGKSTLIAALLTELAAAGSAAGYLHPVLFESEATSALAASELALFAGLTSGHARVLNTPADAASISLDGVAAGLVVQARDEAGADGRIVLVEAPGSVDDGEGIAPADYSDALDARVLLVMRYFKGLDVVAVQRAAGAFGDRCIGVYLNLIPASYLGYANEVLLPSLGQAGIHVWGLGLMDAQLQMPTIGQLADAIDGRFLNDEEKRDELVEHLLVGARSWDPASPYLARKSGFAFITRGDLQDVQLAAINATTRCIVLTTGVGPSTALRYRAAEAGIPVIVTARGTVDAVTTLDRALGRFGFSQAAKAGFAHAALSARGDLAGLAASVSGG